MDTPAIIRDYLTSPRHPTPTHTYTPFLVFPPSKLARAAGDHNSLQFEQVCCLKACTGSAARKQSVLPHCCSTWRQALPWLWTRTRIRARQPPSPFSPLPLMSRTSPKRGCISAASAEFFSFSKPRNTLTAFCAFLSLLSA